MDFQAFKDQLRNAVRRGTVFQNPGGGTTEVVFVSDDAVSYRRGKSKINVSLQDLFDAYRDHRGRHVSSTDLRIFRPSVFDSQSKPAGHSCNCTFLFLILQRLGIVKDIQGKGVKGNPYFVKIPQ
jgi:hypothetical protein